MFYYYSILEELPSGGVNLVDLAGSSFTGSSTLHGDLSVIPVNFVDLAGSSFTESAALAGDLSVILANFVDLGGSLTGSSTLTGDLAVTLTGSVVDLAGSLVGSASLHGDLIGSIVSNSKYGLGAYGVGPYSVAGPANVVTLLGALTVQSALGGEMETAVQLGRGWVPVPPCPPSLWTPVDPCNETESSSLELVE